MKSRLNLQQCKLKVISDETSHTVETCQGTNKNVIKGVTVLLSMVQRSRIHLTHPNFGGGSCIINDV